MKKSETMKRFQEPPTGIIRTIPTLADNGPSRDQYLRSLEALKNGRIEAVQFALGTKPKYELLHLYILSAGRIIIRFNLVGYNEGEPLKCWDGQIRKPACWAACVDPVEPPRLISMRGFRGFRYTHSLW